VGHRLQCSDLILIPLRYIIPREPVLGQFQSRPQVTFVQAMVLMVLLELLRVLIIVTITVVQEGNVVEQDIIQILAMIKVIFITITALNSMYVRMFLLDGETLMCTIRPHIGVRMMGVIIVLDNGISGFNKILMLAILTLHPIQQ
jgi:hypothetical protein